MPAAPLVGTLMGSDRPPHARGRGGVRPRGGRTRAGGLGVIIAAAGGAAHLAEVVPAHTSLPVVACLRRPARASITDFPIPSWRCAGR